MPQVFGMLNEMNTARKTKRDLVPIWLTRLAWAAGIGGAEFGLMSIPIGPGSAADAYPVYKTTAETKLTLAVYRPRDWRTTDRRPCVIWFFGGGFESGSPVQFSDASRRMARELGMVAISADYRVRMRHGSHITPLDAVRDARSALRWVRDHAAELGIDPARIAAGGGSSGGHLALACAALDGPDEPGEADSGTSPAPSALVLFNPVADFDIPFVRQKATGSEFDTLLTVSPMQQLSRPLPPALILHGADDRIVPVESVQRFAEKAKELGSESIDLTVYPGKGHEFHLHGFNGNRDFEEAMARVEAFFEKLGWRGTGGIGD